MLSSKCGGRRGACGRDVPSKAKLCGIKCVNVQPNATFIYTSNVF